MPTTWWVAIVISAACGLCCTAVDINLFSAFPTGVCIRCRGRPYRNHAGKTPNVMYSGGKWNYASYFIFFLGSLLFLCRIWIFPILFLITFICIEAAINIKSRSVFWLCSDLWFSITALDSTHTTTGWQRHLHRFCDDADVWHHPHAGVQAASHLHPQGAQETQDGPPRWVFVQQYVSPALAAITYLHIHLLYWQYLFLLMCILKERVVKDFWRIDTVHAEASLQVCWVFLFLLECVRPAAARKKKKGHGETVIPPRSLFEKASMLKVRREGKDQKKNFSLKQQAPFAKPLPSLVKPAMEAGQDNPEWLISEDWALLQVLAPLTAPMMIFLSKLQRWEWINLELHVTLHIYHCCVSDRL